MQVVWDADKAFANCQKHRISFLDGATVLDDSVALTVEDRRFDEVRFIKVGCDATGRILTIVYTYSEPADCFRLISARRATGYERRQYEYGIEN
ncbi:MAG: BrnT family toxin [Candidatus Eremiobacteraeota bacterium]|nr:BrnT family toxin [Candidatus Eremiobacteraeota bacterium]